jgi:hypothetical protein
LIKINPKTINKCFQCNSKLILVKTWKETTPGGMFPQTFTIYRCSNEECQKQKDKEEVKRQQAVKEKEQRAKDSAKKARKNPKSTKK